MVLLGFSNPFPSTKSLSFVFIPLLKLALQVGLPLVEVLVCPVGPLIFLSRFSDHFLLSLINFAVIALLSSARDTQSIRLQKTVFPFFCAVLPFPKGPGQNMSTGPATCMPCRVAFVSRFTIFFPR